MTNTGLQSGLDKTVSDYVGRVDLSAEPGLSRSSRAAASTRKPLRRERLELESRANFDRWTVQMMYGDYAAQPEIGFVFRREGILAGASFKVTQNWMLVGSVRYDLAVNQFDQTRFGIGYVDDCFMLSLNWLTGVYLYSDTTTGAEQHVHVPAQPAHAGSGRADAGSCRI